MRDPLEMFWLYGAGMSKIFTGIALAMALAGVAAIGVPASAFAQTRDGITASQELSAQQRRKRITVYPRSQRPLGPNSVRQCRTRLQKEYRPSGTVIFPRMVCWWE